MLPIRGLSSLRLLDVIVIIDGVAAVVVLAVLHLDVVLELLPSVLAGRNLRKKGKGKTNASEVEKECERLLKNHSSRARKMCLSLEGLCSTMCECFADQIITRESIFQTAVMTEE